MLMLDTGWLWRVESKFTNWVEGLEFTTRVGSIMVSLIHNRRIESHRASKVHRIDLVDKRCVLCFRMATAKVCSC